ncbi:hypothetical protein Dvina_04280 [Dactylosporangium vinaceum]|uniref:Nucleoside phosphorylase domain-containing protein n=1 Tax=Dactylosporangium vinaceum TaxID=53362 RepID=A0ABV5M0I0_9ACTN|nr:hypothetical protein [Dactylosporangium vinaceum]UAB97403.1 hypothetical protein Dvina_04280 [Dactylosporangium vinaceum]
MEAHRTTAVRADSGAGRASWRDCQAAARAVREAEFGDEALSVVRPRGVLGIFRARAPLAVMLYAASRDGRLVWRSPGAFALLRPPTDKAMRRPPGLRPALLRLVDRRWDFLAMALPPGIALLSTLILALSVDVVGRTAVIIVGLPLALLAALYLAILMTLMLVIAVRRTYRDFRHPQRPRDVALADLLPSYRWSMILCHQEDPQHAEELLRAVDRHFGRLLVGEARRVGDEIGVTMLGATAAATLVCISAGITTGPMRGRVARWSGGDIVDAATLRVTAKRSRRLFPQFDRGAFAFWYLGGVTALLALMATLVPDWERDTCGAADCAGRPTSYLEALHWLMQRLFFTDPEGLSPKSYEAWTVGWTVSLLTPVGVLVLIAAAFRFRRARKTDMELNEAAEAVLHQTTTVLLLVATPIERTAVLAAVRAANDTEPEVRFVQSQTVLNLGRISGAEILLVQTGPGAVGPSAAAITAAALIQNVSPDYIILTGLCFGLRPERQALGNVVVSAQMRAIDHRKVLDGIDGTQQTLIRGDLVSASTRLTQSFAALEYNFTCTTVHHGTMLSSSTLVNSEQLVDELLRIDPEAQGGEMEGAGVYAAAAPEKTDWIIVKGICDWGHDKTDDAQRLAADNAAAFVVHVIKHGALDNAPVGGAQRR